MPGDRGLRVVAVLSALLAAGGVAIFVFVIRDDRLPTFGPSMRPTLDGHVDVDVDVDAYEGEPPRIGDIVTVQAPAGVDGARCGVVRRPGASCARPLSDYAEIRVLKRVVAGPGDSVAFGSDGSLIRNGRRIREAYIRTCRLSCALPRSIRVPRGHYFLAGDNRPVSSDSRDWGPIPRDAIDGQVLLPGGGD